jgi:hypothetical protein
MGIQIPPTHAWRLEVDIEITPRKVASEIPRIDIKIPCKVDRLDIKIPRIDIKIPCKVDRLEAPNAHDAAKASQAAAACVPRVPTAELDDARRLVKVQGLRLRDWLVGV